MPKSESHYTNVVFLHDREDNPNGQVGALSRLVSDKYPEVEFRIPLVLMLPDVNATFNHAAIDLLPTFQTNTLVVGLGFGGLLAAAMQERFTTLNLSVFAINAPPCEDGLELSWNTGPSMSSVRIALYSSQYEPIKKSAHVWPEYSEYAFDVPWLADGLDKAMYATAYLISSCMRGLDLPNEVATMLPRPESIGI